MRLYLAQHGLAKDKSEDPERPLTEQGLLDVAKMAAFLKPLGLSTAVIWRSGKTRAQQTAELLAEAFAPEEGVVRRIGLSPNDDVRPIAEAATAAHGDMVIVGHLPFISRLASRLLAGDENADVVGFKNGGVVCLERSDGEYWSLAWAMTPQLMP